MTKKKEKVNWTLVKKSRNVVVEKTPLENGGFRYRKTFGSKKPVYFKDYEAFKKGKNN